REVPRAQQGRVERYHEVRVAGGSSAPQKAHGQLIIGRPVELIPTRSFTVGRCDLFYRVGGLSGVDVRQLQVGGGAGAGQLGVRVCQFLNPDRREENRGGHAGAEDGRGQVALRAVASLPPLDIPLPERLRVRARGLGIAGARQDVCQWLRGEDLGGQALQLREILGDPASRHLAAGGERLRGEDGGDIC